MKFEVWTHIDSGILQKIEAKNQDEAEANLDLKDFNEMILNNIQFGKNDIKEVV